MVKKVLQTESHEHQFGKITQILVTLCQL